MTRIRSPIIRLLLAPLPALTIGLLVMARDGLPPGIWLGNLVAALVGVLVVVFAGRPQTSTEPTFHRVRWLAAGSVVVLGATLIAPGVEDVHRWLPLGPLQLHVGAVVLPLVLVFLGDLGLSWSVGLSVPTLIVLALQPDAAQAVAFAAGWSTLTVLGRHRKVAGPIVVVTLLAVVSALRPDPLQPIPHVEGIVGLATEQGPVWGVVGLFSLCLLPLGFLPGLNRRIGWALAVYMGCTLLAAWIGPFPVPILGYGMSPILGYYLAVAAVRRTPSRHLQSGAPSA